MIELPKVTVNVAMNDGGLGDQIARLPAIKYCLDQYPHVNFEVWSPDYFIPLARNMLQGYESRCQFISQGRMVPPWFNDSLMAVGFLNDYVTTLSMHLVDHAFAIMNGSIPQIEYRNYLKLKLDTIDMSNLSPLKLETGRYVCLTPGYTAVVRAMLPAEWNKLAQWLMQNEFTPVWLGNEVTIVSGSGLQSVTIRAALDEEVDYSVGLDLRNKTTLLEAGALMAGAAAVVGVDNGLLHLAACSDVQLVAGYTTVAPQARLPYRNNRLGWHCRVIEPEQDLACKFCQSSSMYLYNWDFRNCYTKKLDCVKQMTAAKFISALEEVLCN